MLQFVRDNALLVAAIWIAASVICGLWCAATIALGEREPPYDWEDSAERAAQPPDRDPNTVLSTRQAEAWGRPRRSLDADPDADYQGSWERDSGHGASW